ncbi:hypothetical protein LNV23_16420 [Paucibacter sp. DJ1R-11]|uniref:hypothetical protein n=1 Tax=Paucibacter sp. DJ1R-11 TaxID=2893556 RepID=UPI0021E48FA8|nr:hypothetical protein [Paucibacter sp. DJ1R-11]MCV2365038.1 hypothetical protein [Paucibacter sp. DJ1R-11]
MRASFVRRAGQSGQATVEFAIACLVLLPMFIALPLLGKLLDMMQATESASRYVAFEGAARNSASSWKSDAELSAEVRRRFFSSSGAPIKTGDTAGDFTAHRNPMWSDHAGRPLLKSFEDDVKVDTQIQGKNAIAAAKLHADSLKLPDQNWYQGQVTVKIANVEGFAPFDTINLASTRRTVLLADAWTARNLAMVRGRIEDAALLYPIGQVAGLVDALGQTPTLVFDPALKVGNFDWDLVPCDRLIGGC